MAFMLQNPELGRRPKKLKINTCLRFKHIFITKKNVIKIMLRLDKRHFRTTLSAHNYC